MRPKLAIVMAMWLAPGIAAAQPPRSPPAAVNQARQQVTAADIDYRLGRFADALAKYTRAYELYPVPELLFNIAQCHRNLKNYDKAIFFFEGYLRDLPQAPNHDLVIDLIRESKAELAKLAPAADAPPAEPPPPPPIVTPPLPPASAPDHTDPALSDPPHRRYRILPIALVGGGIAAAAGGGVFYYYGRKRGPDEMFVYDDTRWLGGAMMVVGGAAIVAGTVLWLRGGSPGAAPPGPVAAVTPGGAYLGWAGAF
jgi:tetratricopeptide (TPR) repeat protein